MTTPIEILKESLKLGLNRKPNLTEIQELLVSESIQFCTLTFVKPFINMFVQTLSIFKVPNLVTISTISTKKM